MTTTISNLPMVLLEEIFSRVPLKYLCAVRLTCKSWYTLSNNRSFVNMYISKAVTREEESMMIMLMNFSLCLMKVNVDDIDHPSIEFKQNPSFFNEQVMVYRVFHCNGLLLCIMSGDAEVVVLNPYSGETRWIEPRYYYFPNRWDTFRYALGYGDKRSCRNVKFLRFIDNYPCRAPEKEFSWYEIYDFDSDSWTTLDVNPHWFITSFDLGVTVKGNTYWPVSERNSESDYMTDHIICFDFTRMRFGPLLPLPVSFRDNEYEYVTLSCVREEKLAALFQYNEYKHYELEIWITTKIDSEMVSWSKFLRVEAPIELDTHICERYFINEENKFVMGFNNEDDPLKFSIIGEAGYVKDLDLGGLSVNPNFQMERPHVLSYVPSLLQIKKHAQDKGKKESSLEEEHRFAENMLRLAAFDKPV